MDFEQKPKIPAPIPRLFFVRRNPNKPCRNCRLSFTGQKSIPDLHGLPPTPYQIYQFRLSWEKIEKAWTDLIDQLLDSPHFGERSAQHWLDVADMLIQQGFPMITNARICGGTEIMWSDLSIRISLMTVSLLNKLPGTRFGKTKMKEKDSELLIATSFLRMGPWDPAMVLKPQARQLYLDDVVNAGETF